MQNIVKHKKIITLIFKILFPKTIKSNFHTPKMEKVSYVMGITCDSTYMISQINKI